MLEITLLLASMLASLPVVSARDTVAEPDDGSEKNICYDIGVDYIKCNNAPTCKWDVEDGRCEPLVAGLCSVLFDEDDCDSAEDCVWDTYEGRCEHV